MHGVAKQRRLFAVVLLQSKRVAEVGLGLPAHLHGQAQFPVRNVEPLVQHEHFAQGEHHVVRVLIARRIRDLPRVQLQGSRAVRRLDVLPDLRRPAHTYRNVLIDCGDSGRV